MGRSRLQQQATLAEVLSTPRARREILWDEAFLRVFPESDMLMAPHPIYAGDNYAYIVLYMPDNPRRCDGAYEVPVPEAIGRALELGCGLAVNPHDTVVDWKFRLGDLVCYRMLGVFYAGGAGCARSHYVAEMTPEERLEDEQLGVSKESTTVEAGRKIYMPPESLLGEHTAWQIGQTLKHLGLESPRAAFVKDENSAELSFLTNCVLEQFENEADAQLWMRDLCWFLPSHVTVTLLEQGGMEELGPVLYPFLERPDHEK